MKSGVLGSVVGAVTVCVALAVAGPAGAALTVSGTGDSGGCSLRATIEDVNNGTAGGCGALEGNETTIDVPAGHYLLTSGELVVKTGANVVLVGADPANPAATTIDGHETSRVLEVASGAGATLDGIEVTGGATLHGTDATAPDGSGGLAEDGGGILNKGSVTLEHVLLTGNRTGRGGNGGGGTLSNGSARNGGGGSQGGDGGGIDNEAGASLSVVASTISGNLTGDGGLGGNGAHGQSEIPNIPAGGQGGIGGEGGNGGGIYNAGTLTITTSTISGNATGRGGTGGAGGEGADATAHTGAGLGGWGARGGNSGLQYPEGSDTPAYAEFGGGGGIDSVGTLTITDSTITGNHTGAGGLGGGAGIGGEKGGVNPGPETGGKAGAGGGAGLGGGLLVNGTGASSLVNVTVSGNFTGDGGNGGNGAQSNSRGGGNGGFGGYGGGIWAYGSGRPNLQLTFVTVAGNHVGAEGQGGADNEHVGFHGGPGLGTGIATGPAFNNGASVTLADSIVAANGGAGEANCNEIAPGAIADGGHDLTSDASCKGTVGNPLLGALANNGGLTETMLPGTGSAAIGVVPSGSCSPYVDQRGDSRPGSGKSACDAGAVETGGAGGGPGESGGGGGGGGGEPGGGGGAEPGTGTGGGSGTPPGTGSSSGSGSSGGGSPTGGSESKSPPAPAAGKVKVGAVKVKGTSVSVAISCAGPKNVACAVKVTLSTKGAKAMTIGAASARVPGGATKTVTVSLDGAGKSDLAKAHSLKATLTVDEIGRTKPVSVRTVTFTEG
jgi:hypothetical protein